MFYVCRIKSITSAQMTPKCSSSFVAALFLIADLWHKMAYTGEMEKKKKKKKEKVNLRDGVKMDQKPTGALCHCIESQSPNVILGGSISGAGICSSKWHRNVTIMDPIHSEMWHGRALLKGYVQGRAWRRGVAAVSGQNRCALGEWMGQSLRWSAILSGWQQATGS